MEEQQSEGPLTGIVQSSWEYLYGRFTSELPPDLHWQPLLLTLLLAVALFALRRGRGSRGADGRARKANLLTFLFPKDVYTHVSARVDIGLWLLERLLYPLWAVALLATVGPYTEQTVIQLMQALPGESPALQSSLPWMLLYSLVSLLLFDFVFFLTHYAFHKVPALWPIHQVHHSAEVLTPLTRHREHILAGPIWLAGSAFSYGIAAGIFAFLFADPIKEATVMNIGFFALLFGFNGAFRHYHVQFHYPRWLAKWLHSPAMHHVHHSYLPQHIDKNFAAVTSIWDRLFGTLYLPQIDEYTPWGLGPQAQDEHRSVWQNTVGPFKAWRKMLFANTPAPSERADEA